MIVSRLDAEIHHVPSPENIVSDVLSRQHKDIQDIFTRNKVQEHVNFKINTMNLGVYIQKLFE
jgi:hypothetical protein